MSEDKQSPQSSSLVFSLVTNQGAQRLINEIGIPGDDLTAQRAAVALHEHMSEASGTYYPDIIAEGAALRYAAYKKYGEEDLKAAGDRTTLITAIVLGEHATEMAKGEDASPLIKAAANMFSEAESILRGRQVLPSIPETTFLAGTIAFEGIQLSKKDGLDAFGRDAFEEYRQCISPDTSLGRTIHRAIGEIQASVGANKADFQWPEKHQDGASVITIDFSARPKPLCP